MKLMDSCVLIMLLFVYFRNPWLKSRFFLNLCQLKCLIFILLYKITAKLSKNQFHEIFGLKDEYFKGTDQRGLGTILVGLTPKSRLY